MSRHHSQVRSSVTLTGWAVALAAGISVAASSTVSALDLPSPTTSSAPTAPTTANTLGVPSVSTLVGHVTAPLTSAANGSTTGTPSLPTGPATGLPALPAGPSAPSLGAVGSGVKSGLATAKAKAAGTPVGAVVPGAAPGDVLEVGINAAPLASACLQATGSGTAVANTTVTLAGHDVTAPLVQALPGLLAACPRGSVPSSQGVDASVSGLVGVCVRVTPQAPLHASILVLDKELVGTLTRSGVPLQQAVVPCPAGTAGAVGTTPHGNQGSGAAAHPNGPKGTTARPAANHGAPAGTGGTCAAGGSGGTSIDARSTAASILPHDAPQALPWVLLALALVGRRRLGRLVATLRGARIVG